MTEPNFGRIASALSAIRDGKMVILVDDEDRENEGDLVMAAERVQPEDINFMAKWGRGLICVTLTEERLTALKIPMMVETNTASFGTAFTVSIEAKTGVSTGISAADRAHTISVAVSDRSRPEDLVSPGHVFPLRAKRGGVLVRTGQTEGSVDLARLAGLKPAGVICEIMNDDGTMARRADLEQFAATHDLLIVSIAELIEYRLAHDRLVRRMHTVPFVHPRWGALTAHVYESEIDGGEHLALVFGKPSGETLVRVQSAPQQWFDPLFGETTQTIEAALSRLAVEKEGILVVLSPPLTAGSTTPPSLSQVLLAKAEQNPPGGPLGSDRSEGPKAATESEALGRVPLREFGVGAQILSDLGVHKIRLLSNHPRRLPGIGGFGLELKETVPFAPEGSEQKNRSHG